MIVGNMRPDDEFRCNYCPFSFDIRGKLTQSIVLHHLEEAHPGMLELASLSDGLEYHCNYCGDVHDFDGKY